MAIYSLLKNYRDGVDARCYESTSRFGDYYRVIVNLKHNLFEFYEIRDRRENLCFTLKYPKTILDKLGYNLYRFCSYEHCMCFIYDFCSYIRRENPTLIHIRLEKDWAVNHSLERFI